MQAVAVTGLSKHFDEVQALDGISFDVRRGELFGFLGPNGAGESPLDLSFVIPIFQLDEAQRRHIN